MHSIPRSEGIALQSMASDKADNRAIGVDPGSPVSKLSNGQIECLLLVDRHHNSKEIAVQLGVSPHTVDQRVRGALKKLGVKKRGDAARLLIATLPPSDPAYQHLTHQSLLIEDATRTSIQPAGHAGEASPSGYLTEQSPVGFSPPLQLPFATRNHPSNEMGAGQRLFWIVLIAIGATFSAGMYLAGLESLSRMING